MSSEKRTPAQRKRGKRTAPAKASAAGGEWGERFRERLLLLVKAHSTSNAAFARACGIQAPRLCEWLAGEQVPSVKTLRAVANAFSVSLDWLLGGLNHHGEVSASPVYRGQWRDSPALEHDLREAIIRRLPPDVRRPVPEVLNADAILEHVAADVATWLRSREENDASFRRREQYASDFAAIFEAVISGDISANVVARMVRRLQSDARKTLGYVPPAHRYIQARDDTALRDLKLRLEEVANRWEQIASALETRSDERSFVGARCGTSRSVHTVIGLRPSESE